MTIRTSHRVFTPSPEPVPRERGRPTRETLLNGRSHFSCFYCREKFPAREATLEHIIPLAYGGTYHLDNCTLACCKCNRWRNELVLKIQKGEPFAEHRFPKYLWTGIACVAGQYCFEVPGSSTPASRPGNVVATTFHRTDFVPRKKSTSPAPQAPPPPTPGAFSQDDISWFKAQVHNIRNMIRDKKFDDAYLLAHAVVTMPRNMRPSKDPDGVAKFIANEIERKREYHISHKDDP